MVNQQKAELSKKNPYWISKDKYYEMLYFSRQYNTMRQEKKDILRTYPSIKMNENVVSSDISDPVVKSAMRLEELDAKMKLIEDTAKEAGTDIYKWLLIGVTTDYSYNYLAKKLNMPAGKDMYYSRYRKYFYLLSKKR